MIMMLLFWALLVLLPSFFHISFAQTSVIFTISSSSTSTPDSIIYLNSTTRHRTWNNNDISINENLTGTVNGYIPQEIRVILSRRTSGTGFVCGFYCLYFPADCLFSVVAVGGGDPTVVWSANGNQPVSDDGALQLSEDGGLVLRGKDGVNVWSTNNTSTGHPVSGMNLTENGNLLLFDKQGSTVWQSFDHPTNTLLLGQRLNEGQQLTSMSSEYNWTTGLYYATVTAASGFAAFTHIDDQGPPSMYYQLVPHRNSSAANMSTTYAEFKDEGLLVKVGAREETFSRYVYQFPSYVFYLRLDSSGHLKVHQRSAASEVTEILDLVSQDLGECQYPRVCGDFGLCRQGQCSCPISDNGTHYFQQGIVELPDEGCSRNTPLSCHDHDLDRQQLVKVSNVTYFNIVDSYAAFPNIKNVEGCKRACMRNCSCNAAFFRYDQNVSDGYCFMPSKVLSLRENSILYNNFSMETYIKVQSPNSPPNSAPDALRTIRPTPLKGKRMNLAAIISGSAAGGFIILSFGIAIVVRMQKGNTADEEDYISHIPGMPARFSFEDLRQATEDFKEKIGAGGFGTVFRGVLGDGTQVAVKRIDKLSQGTREFLAEVESIGSIHHFNLVRLIGYCAEKSSRMLVYEFMVNRSLDNWIFNKPDQRYHCLTWQTRKKIILDIARGLAYLHEECRQRILHLDIKPQNILLDENFNAKVSDFGLAKLIDRDESQVHTTMKGTPGYIAPEWRLLRITVKVDIYSFGMVVLEIVCGRRNLDHTRPESRSHLLRLLEEKAKEGKILDIVENLDINMKDHAEQVERMIKIGAWCLQDDYTKRPSMSKVVNVLENAMTEVDDQNISYNFTHAMTTSSPVVEGVHVSIPPEASVLSSPR